jgi:hypothetical protein
VSALRWLVVATGTISHRSAEFVTSLLAGPSVFCVLKGLDNFLDVFPDDQQPLIIIREPSPIARLPNRFRYSCMKRLMSPVSPETSDL